MSTIKLEKVTKSFGKVLAINDINMIVNNGEFMVLLGPSGCGKTTTLLTIAGIYKPTSGNIYFDEQIVNNLPSKYRKIGMVFQNYALYPHMTIFENIAFPLRAMKIPNKDIDKKVRAIAFNLGIDTLLDRKPSQISGGQQQRVAIARALIKEPSILLFDEPLSNLDANLRVSTRAEIKRLQSTLKITTVYVTHDQSEAMVLGDKIAIFNNGYIVQLGTPNEVYNHPQNIFVAGFLGNPPMNLIYEIEIYSDNGQLYITKDKKNLLKIKVPNNLQEIKRDKVVFGFRPEDCKISAEEESGIKGEVYVIEKLGRENLVTVKISDTFVKLFSDKTNIKENQIVTLSIDLSKIHLFDQQTGESIL
jgi:inositol-phosphate transport system ATP-binding protein